MHVWKVQNDLITKKMCNKPPPIRIKIWNLFWPYLGFLIANSVEQLGMKVYNHEYGPESSGNKQIHQTEPEIDGN